MELFASINACYSYQLLIPAWSSQCMCRNDADLHPSFQHTTTMSTLYVGNLVPACNEDMIGRSFVRFGDIQKSMLFSFNDICFASVWQ